MSSSTTPRERRDEDAFPIVDVSALVDDADDAATDDVRRELGRAMSRAIQDGHGCFLIRRARVASDARVAFAARDGDDTECVLFDDLRRWFARDEREKSRVGLRKGRGYQRLGENVTEGAPDAHEALDFYNPISQPFDAYDEPGTLRGPHPDVGDDALVRKVDTTAKWWLRLGRCMLAALALAEDVPVGAFDAMTNESFWIMRLIHSPGAEDDEEKVSTGAHTDYGFLSFLDATASGLQVDCDGEWRDVPNIPGTVACNVGEMLQLFMEVDGVSAFKACRHRVVRRRDADADAAKSRFSIAFFLEPNYDACVAPRQLTADANDPTYAARVVRYSEFLKSKVKTNFICPDD